MESRPKEETQEEAEEDLELLDRMLLDLEEPPFCFDIAPRPTAQLETIGDTVVSFMVGGRYGKVYMVSFMEGES
jgi:hypothetical protein